MTMTYRKRYKPEPKVNIRLTEDDLLVMRHVYRHRFLTSEHLRALMPHRSKRMLGERLRELTHQRYLERPRKQQQLHHFVRGSLPLVYALGDKGADVLAKVDGVSRHKIRWQDKNREVGHEHIEHTLRTADSLVAFEVAYRCRGSEYLHAEALLKSAPALVQKEREPFRTSIKANVEGAWRSLPLVPDGAFGFVNASGQTVFCLLETDRATMPIFASRLERSSVYKKFLAYHRALETGLFKERYAQAAVLVFTVTTSEARVGTMLEALEAAKTATGSSRSNGHFLFRVQSTVTPERVLSEPWLRGDGKHVVL